jgi:hypothetical protein
MMGGSPYFDGLDCSALLRLEGKTHKQTFARLVIKHRERRVETEPNVDSRLAFKS